MQLQHIKIGKLEEAAINIRHGKKVPDVSNILPSVKARGILVPLLVRPNGGDDTFEIVAGRRRYFAAKVVEAGSIEPLPCPVMETGNDVAALEASMLENFARLDPDEMTQYETFVRLAKAGKTVEDIASTFGVTELIVKRRLALGNLMPRIRDVYRDENIDAETVRHLTMASKTQQRDWLQLFSDPERYAPRGCQLKQWLFGGQQIAADTALFPLEDYKGQMISDLIGEECYFADADLFWTLQNAAIAAIAAKRDTLIEAGWADVEILEIGDRLCTWEHEKTPKNAGGRVYVSVSQRGEAEVHDGWLTRKETNSKRRGKEKQEGSEEARKEVRPELTNPAQNSIELHRHAAVRHAMLAHAGVALRMMVAHER